MRAVHVVVGAAVLSMALLLPARAEAEQVSAPSRGMTLGFGFAANGLTDDDYVEGLGGDLEPLVGLHLSFLYRLMPYVSAGLLVDYGFIYPDSDYDEEFSGFAAVIGAVRGHYAFGRIEPWMEFGIGYASAHWWAKGEWSYWIFHGEAEGSLSLHGVGFDLALGVHFYLTDSFSLSPFFRIVLAAWPTACYWWETDADEDDDCDDPDDIYADEPDDWPYLWSVGIEAATSL